MPKVATNQIKHSDQELDGLTKQIMMFAALVVSTIVVIILLNALLYINFSPVATYKFTQFDLVMPSDNTSDMYSYWNSEENYKKTQARMTELLRLTPKDNDEKDPRSLTVDSKDSERSHDPYFSMHVTQQDIHEMTVELPATLKDYRNPCWIELVPEDFSYFKETFFYQYYHLYPEHQPPRDWMDTYTRMEELIQARKEYTEDGRGWRLRCFPYFMLIGFTKAGTSDMRRSLSKLPDFVPGIIKETKFWNKISLDAHLGADVLPKPTLSDYLDLYDRASEDLRHYVNFTDGTKRYHPGIVGDFDPQTIWQLPNWQMLKGNEHLQEPRYITAHHIHSIRPETKLIVLMRDPVERAFSHYRFFKSRKTGSRVIYADKFHEDIVKAIKKLTNCFKDKSIRACVYFAWKYDPTLLRSITASMYHVYIKDWMDVFPRNQFLFLRSEDYFADRCSAIEQIISFLKIDNPIPKSMRARMADLKVVNPSDSVSGMANETKQLLRDFFRPYNKQLAQLLKDDGFLWDY